MSSPNLISFWTIFPFLKDDHEMINTNESTKFSNVKKFFSPGQTQSPSLPFSYSDATHTHPAPPPKHGWLTSWGTLLVMILGSRPWACQRFNDTLPLASSCWQQPSSSYSPLSSFPSSSYARGNLWSPTVWPPCSLHCLWLYSRIRVICQALVLPRKTPPLPLLLWTHLHHPLRRHLPPQLHLDGRLFHPAVCLDDSIHRLLRAWRQLRTVHADHDGHWILVFKILNITSYKLLQ